MGISCKERSRPRAGVAGSPGPERGGWGLR